MRHSTRPEMLNSFSFSSRVVTMPLEEDFAFAAEGVDFVGELLVGEGIGVAEGEVFELAAEFAHAEAVGERSVDVEGLPGDLLALLGLEVLEGAHVVEAVGELDDDDADVGDHGEEHLAYVLGLLVFAIGELDVVEFGDAFDDVGDLFAEAFFDLVGGDVGVFDGVVEQAGGDGGGVHLELGENEGDFERMDDVGFTGGALLAFVLLQAELPGLADDVEVVAGAVVMDFFEEPREFGVEFVDYGGAGSYEVARRALFGYVGGNGRGCFGAEGFRRRAWRESCLQLMAGVGRNGLGTRSLEVRGCSFPISSGSCWSDCHIPL